MRRSAPKRVRVIEERKGIIRVKLLVLLVVCSLVTATSSFAGHRIPHKPFPQMTLKEKVRWLHRQIVHDQGALRWYQRHTHKLHPPELRFLQAYIRYKWTTEINWFESSLRIATVNYTTFHRQLVVVNSLPAHDALWECLFLREGGGDHNNHDTGHNGHYGGLQMHPGWGYGTSYFASDDPWIVQKQSAERGYAASGYSSSWLWGQWGQTLGSCTDNMA